MRNFCAQLLKHIENVISNRGLGVYSPAGADLGCPEDFALLTQEAPLNLLETNALISLHVFV